MTVAAEVSITVNINFSPSELGDLISCANERNIDFTTLIHDSVMENLYR
jgi:hypothetical protein